MRKITFLYFIIFLEGYIVLSAELLAIRQLISFVGSGTDTISIIIAAVLMPLAIGYYIGGGFKEAQKTAPNKITIRQKLLKNIFIATMFLMPALSYIVLSLFFETLSFIGIHSRLLSTALYAAIFLVYPIFLLAQTIPLISNFFDSSEISRVTGKMLFFSTLGSFMGATFSTLILMATIGVHHTATLSILGLCALYFALSKRKITPQFLTILFIGGLALLLNSDNVMRDLKIVENNQYNTIKISENSDGLRILSLNNNRSSAYKKSNDQTQKRNFFGYVNYINRNFISPINNEEEPTRSILVIGAGGFTVGLQDHKNEYVFVDIDSSLKEISETHFLEQKLGKNKHFEPIPARSYLRKAKQNGQKFDLIVLDAYHGASAIPEHLITKEFYEDVKNLTKEDGIIVGNFIASATFNTAFSMKLDNTLKSVFPFVSRQFLSNKYNGWSDNARNKVNIIYIYHHRKNQENGIYTDNRNRVFYDKDRSVR
jgi:spermidine synthase